MFSLKVLLLVSPWHRTIAFTKTLISFEKVLQKCLLFCRNECKVWLECLSAYFVEMNGRCAFLCDRLAVVVFTNTEVTNGLAIPSYRNNVDYVMILILKRNNNVSRHFRNS